MSNPPTGARLAGPDLREQLAALAHEQWSGWMAYLFRRGAFAADGTWTMPEWAVQRWLRQANTDYESLTEGERESDRREADKVLALLNTTEPTDPRTYVYIDEAAPGGVSFDRPYPGAKPVGWF